MRRGQGAVTLAVAGALLAPAGAGAATASVVADTLRFEAAPGEANRVRLSEAADGIAVRDAGAPLQPGAGCSAAGAHTVLCEFPDRVAVELGDGPDELTDLLEATRPALVRAGPGPDRLRGGDGPDELDGGAGRDALAGGRGDDLMTDDDRLPTSAPDARGVPDVLDGGPGRDRLSYRMRPARVVVDLARRRGADGDRLRGIEDAEGGAGADELRGDRGPNRLFGLGRGDALEGRAGGDTLTGGDGADRLLGGSGHDLLEAAEDGAPAPADRAGCGSGRDTVAAPDLADRVGGDCERAVLDEPGGGWQVALALPLPVARDGNVALRLRDTAGAPQFAGRATLRFGSLFLGRPSRVVRLRARGRATARVRIVRAALTRLRASGRLTVRVGVGAAGFTTLLRPPRARPPARRRGGTGGGTAPG